MIAKTVRDIIHLMRESAHQFKQHDPITLSGALAFFTVFAIPPVIIIIIFGLHLFVDYQTAEKAIFSQIQASIGQTSADVLKNIVNHYFSGSKNIIQRLLRYAIFIFASSSFFLIIQHAINRIWEVKPRPEHDVLKVLKNRALSFVIIFIMGVLLGLSLTLRSLLFDASNAIFQSPSLFATILSYIFGIILSFLLGTLGLGVIYKFLPDVIIEWKVVWVGAAITSFLFLLGQYIIGFALRGSNVEAMYGTVGSLAIFLLWVFYSSIILFYGAAVTHQYARSFAEKIQPKPHAVKIEIKEMDHNQ